MSYALAVWLEKGVEEEGVVPSSWINKEEKVLLWPTQQKLYCGNKAEKATNRKVDQI